MSYSHLHAKRLNHIPASHHKCVSMHPHCLGSRPCEDQFYQQPTVSELQPRNNTAQGTQFKDTHACTHSKVRMCIDIYIRTRVYTDNSAAPFSAQYLKQGLHEAFSPLIHTPQKSRPWTFEQQVSCVPRLPTNAGASTYGRTGK